MLEHRSSLFGRLSAEAYQIKNNGNDARDRSGATGWMRDKSESKQNVVEEAAPVKFTESFSGWRQRRVMNAGALLPPTHNTWLQAMLWRVLMITATSGSMDNNLHMQVYGGGVQK